jgi:hypothetical protein
LRKLCDGNDETHLCPDHLLRSPEGLLHLRWCVSAKMIRVTICEHVDHKGYWESRDLFLVKRAQDQATCLQCLSWMTT